ncbi:chemotaxis protein CheW [Allochromatium humboldtianum]|uniref:Chemotaxis protein CheW n=1 Tax=Allochromatium humboldtianum TaxID=504901 RepID=A0A850RB96_9GAMM|nr:chemotaxis protein CheW [Allochromatium humboldtianum]NVZ08527.1 chemotaxis protein CheW [Allochromatium humboldtianum]
MASDSLHPNQDPLGEILERRRSGEKELVEVDAPTVKLVVFAIGERLQALPGAQVGEILPLSTIHFVPGCPPALEGVISVRGDITSVIRLGDLLGIEHGASGRQGAILLAQGSLEVGGEPMRSGLRVDRVVDVLDVVEDSLQPVPDTLPESLRRAARGVFQLQERSVLLLNLDALFQDYLSGAG